MKAPRPKDEERTYDMTEPTKTRLMGINHVTLEVDDAQAALAFYQKLFDFSLRGEGRKDQFFIDMGDQFIQIREKRTQGPDQGRHFGLVVDDRGPVRQALGELGVEMLDRRLNFRDPWGNRIEVIPYSDIQFTKAANILRGMGFGRIAKTAEAIAELKEKGMAGK